MLKKWSMIALAVVFCLGGAGSALAVEITAAFQPAEGPGGEDYDYGFDPEASVETLGIGVRAVKIYEPVGMAGQELPVIAFMHGYWAWQVDDKYIDFIAHLVKKGFVVIYPHYQNLFTPGGQYTDNAAYGIRRALEHMAANPQDHAQMRVVWNEYGEAEKQLAIIGHSMGGTMVGNLAANWEADAYDIPRPLALCFMNGENGNVDLEYGPGNPFHADTNVLVIVGEDDDEIYPEPDPADPEDTEVFWDSCWQIDDSRKDWILVRTDLHGETDDPDFPDKNDLLADHRVCLNTDKDYNRCINNLEYYGYWKWVTALMQYTFYGENGGYALGNTSDQRYMGTWSDGQPVIEPVIGDYYIWE